MKRPTAVDDRRVGAPLVARWRRSARIAALTIFSSVTSSPASSATQWPRETTITRSHRPCSSRASDEATTTGTPLAETLRRMR